jgi:hypothetical protein
MALLALSELIDDVLDEIPGKEQAPIVRGLNKVIRRLQTEVVVPSRGTFTTKVAVTSGTVSVTQDSTTATFSGSVVLAADPVRLVQISGDQIWFTMTRGAADTDGVLSSKWAQATDAAATYTIMYPTISFPSNVGEILSIKRLQDDELDFRVGGQLPQTGGVPSSWSPFTNDVDAAAPSDDLTRILLDPGPQTRETYTYWYKPRTTFVAVAAATTVTVPFSDLWYEAIIQGVLSFMWKQEGDVNKAMISAALYEKAIRRARGAALPGAVIQPRRVSGRGFVYEDRPIA